MSEPESRRRDFHVGPFRLERLIARGGMGSVWYAEHATLGIPVALKFLAPKVIGEASFRTAFAREAEAMASLDHPGIAIVYDFGDVHQTMGPLSGVTIPAGTPYIAMEYASRGSLESLRPPLSWSDIYRILKGLLAALAHAHAHGVVHRDLKPGNILLGSHDDIRTQLKLTDFGIAWTAKMLANTPKEEQAGNAVGTPLYMAPEQIWMRWRDYGPHTDLYALGIIAWELSTGFVPFNKPSILGTLSAHATEPLPAYTPMMPVPDGFENWVRRLLEKAPQDRFQLAADAELALAMFAPTSSHTLPWSLHPGGATPQFAPITQTASPLAYAEPQQRPAAASYAILQTPVATTVPDWRQGQEALAVPRLCGVGIGLIAVRSPAIVAWIEQRELLWATLRQTIAARRPTIALIQGEIGAGRSALAHWLVARAHELGVANYVYMAPKLGESAVAELSSQLFGLHGLDENQRMQRLKLLFDKRGISPESIRRMVGASLGGATARGLFGRPDDRFDAVVEALQAAALPRPLCIVVDEIDDAEEIVDLLESRAVAQAQNLPIVVIAISRALGALGAGSTRLLRSVELITVSTPALSPEESRQLVSSLITLDEPSLQRVLNFANGNPLLLRTQLNEIVAQGFLHGSSEGVFTIDPAATMSAPAALKQLTVQRGRAALVAEGDGAIECVLVAALLGDHITTAVFDAICARYGLVARTLVGRLVRLGHARVKVDGWSFASPVIHRSYCDEASAEAAQAAQRHGQLADALRSPWIPEALRAPAVIAHHFAAAGRYDEAIDTATAAAIHLLEVGELRRCLEMIRERDEFCRQAGLSETSTEFALGLALAADVHIRLGELDKASALALRALSAAVANESRAVQARALDSLSFVDRAQGRSALACERGMDACRLFWELGDAEALARARLNLGHSLQANEQAADAVAQFRDVAQHGETIGDDALAGRANLGMAIAASRLRDTGVALAAVSRAIACFQTVGNEALLFKAQQVRAALNE